ncbi:hypothetical protein LINGRAHAP2_LOCUS16428 [Linum grandiflorum]
MGFLLVFFPDDNKASSGKHQTPQSHPCLSSSSSSPSSADSPGNTTSNFSKQTTTAVIKRTNSSNSVLTRAQSTISICSFLLLFSFLLFALSTFEPPIRPPNPARRFLSDHPPAAVGTSHSLYHWLTDTVRRTETEDDCASFALQGMGQLYRRGTRSMSDLLVGHVAEDTTVEEFRLFLRLLHRSGVTSRTDVVFLFPSSDFRSGFESVILEENDSFSKLIHQHLTLTAVNRSQSALLLTKSRFDATRFVRRRSINKETPVEPTLWGKKIRLNSTTTIDSDASESTRLSYGSVVGFEANELDPENALNGFLQNPPMSLRRWACYPMLLGRVRRSFKHVMLADVKSTLVLAGDPLSRVRNRAPESVVYFTSKHEKGGGRTREKTGHREGVNPAVLTGGGRGIRRFSAAMLTEIVRAAMQHKRKSGGAGVTESGVLSHLSSGGRHILKSVKLTVAPEPLPDWGVLRESDSRYWIIQRGNKKSSDNVESVIMKRICSCEEDQVDSVYRNCCYGREL